MPLRDAGVVCRQRLGFAKGSHRLERALHVDLLGAAGLLDDDALRHTRVAEVVPLVDDVGVPLAAGQHHGRDAVARGELPPGRLEHLVLDLVRHDGVAYFLGVVARREADEVVGVGVFSGAERVHLGAVGGLS